MLLIPFFKRLLGYSLLLCGEIFLWFFNGFIWLLLTKFGEHGEYVNDTYFGPFFLGTYIALNTIWAFKLTCGKAIWKLIGAVLSGIVVPFTYLYSSHLHHDYLYFVIMILTPILFWELMNKLRVVMFQATP